ncbi:RNA polymerase sigma factor [Bradyrhizobium sp. LHD-71]|uniref:RNA polymerase sigma factor n=1 Tax=Bradyrhizobium sp. LHD-71 TaxID=3072141 RepID=UPI00280DB6F6|nr:RNA polymerase sigma factor [Bradyrhizobium sp. LHD-71]MDQ8727795.1 RNA polymerase sigma factor [Bradyrhizobium sp. LHD-71]
MTESSLALVRRFLVDRYGDLKQRLTARLGSSDLAGDALQDAWIKIARIDTVGVVRNPGNYIFGVAMNAARDRMRDVNNRHLSATEIDELLEFADDVPDPSRTAEARSDLRLLEGILQELSPRQRDILLAARLDGTPRLEIARRLGISLRLVEKELQLAQEHCLARRARMLK